MAIKYKGNPLFTMIDKVVIDMMNELEPDKIADFGNGARIPAYSKFLGCYGRIYDKFDSVVADNELGWQYMRYGFNHNDMPHEGLTPPMVVGERTADVWLSRFIMAAMMFIRRETREDLIEQYISSVPVLIGAALATVLNEDLTAVVRRDLTRGDKFFDYAVPEYNSTARIRDWDGDKLQAVINKFALPGDIPSQRIFYVRVVRWMEWMYNQTHPMAQKQTKFIAALRQKAVEATMVIATMQMSKRIGLVPGKMDKLYLETVSDDLAAGNDYTEFKNGLLAEIVDEWNLTTYYSQFTTDVLVYQAISNDMIAEDLFTYRHRILSIHGDEALHIHV